MTEFLPAGSAGAARELGEAARDAFLEGISASAGGSRSRTPTPHLLQQQTQQRAAGFRLLDVAPVVVDGEKVLVEDEFSRCFMSASYGPWNWNAYLLPMWLLGVVVRHLVLFPVRLLVAVLGSLGVLFGMMCVCPLVRSIDRRVALQRRLVRWYGSLWVTVWLGVIKYHGIRPAHRANGIAIANHTTVFDICLLLRHRDYAIIGQKQPGLMGIAEERLLGALGGIWFERKDAGDRSYVGRRLKEHLKDERNSPLLVFPEGTCVNNEYCIQFKKGAFELGATIYPIAIKYNKIFCDPFWNSRTQSFLRHVYNLLTSWAVVADVWYLDPQTIRPDETPTEFANRVKSMIAKKAGLINVPWDGYLKYLSPHESLVEERQRMFSEGLTQKIAERKSRVSFTASDLHFANFLPHPQPQEEPSSPRQQQPAAPEASELRHRAPPSQKDDDETQPGTSASFPIEIIPASPQPPPQATST